MELFSRGVRPIVVSVLVVVALLGYLAGHRRASRASNSSGSAVKERSRLISTADVLLEVPERWLRVPAAPAIPGLQLEGALTLAPGSGANAGLVAGRFAAGEASPLPAAFLRLLHVVPHTDVLSFLGGQAYEYRGFTVPGYGRTLRLYVVPTTGTGTGTTLLACYAAKGFEARLAQCQQIVAKFTLVGQAQYDLNPDSQYAARLGALVRSLDAKRLTLRRQMGTSRTPAGVGALATALGAALAASAASLSALEPPIAAGAAQSSLARALLGARQAYDALAAAASAEILARYDLARGRIERADAAIDTALESFALLGYSRT
jgi:hypothetical protein